ncbi:MAG: hypothetical protein KF752_00710 [Pirellulaceae bacterium]|nr:hypothetical protein [Pirellulaceae bacterium]
MSPTIARGETFGIPELGVRFYAPKSYTPLTKEEIEFKFPSNRAPSYVIGNASRSTTIAFDVKNNPLHDDLDRGLNEFKTLFDRIVPGIEWKGRKIIELQGQKWIYLEMVSRAADTNIHNIMLTTHYRGGMLIFNFNSTVEEFPEVESILRKCIETIKINVKVDSK